MGNTSLACIVRRSSNLLLQVNCPPLHRRYKNVVDANIMIARVLAFVPTELFLFCSTYACLRVSVSWHHIPTSGDLAYDGHDVSRRVFSPGEPFAKHCCCLKLLCIMQ